MGYALQIESTTPVMHEAPVLRLLGPDVSGSGLGDVRLLYRKGWALLAYLLVEKGRSHRRSELANLLWSGMEQGAALTNLRQVLCDLRRKLTPLVGEGALVIGRERVELRLHAVPSFSDVQQLEEMTLGKSAVDLAKMSWLLDCGELLEGWDMPGCEEFNHWLDTTRTWYVQQWRRLLDRMREAAEAWGDWRLALECIRCQMRVAPWDEALHRQRMALYAAMGERTLALASFDALELELKRELGVMPERETLDLARSIRQTSAAASSDVQFANA